MDKIALGFIVFCGVLVSSASAEPQAGRMLQKSAGEIGAGGGAGAVPATADSFAAEFVKALGEEVALDAQQEAKVQAALSQSHKRTKDAWDRQARLQEELREVGSELGREIRLLYENIREVLTHEQRERFDEIRVKMRASKEPPSWALPEKTQRPGGHRWDGTSGPVHGMSGGGGSPPSPTR